MATEKKEMIGLIRKMAETTAAVEWYRLRNNELRGALASICLPSAQAEKTGGGRQGGHGDPVGMTAIRREEMEEEIRRNMARIEERLAHHARLSALMGEALDQDERAILWARYAERLEWERIARRVKMSRSSCFRAEAAGLRKLCAAWDEGA